MNCIQEVMRHATETIDSTTTEDAAKAYYYTAFFYDEVIDALIREVERRPELWDSRSPDFKKLGTKREAAWMNIIIFLDNRVMHLDSKIQNIAVCSMKYRWKKVRATYRRSYNKFKGTFTWTARADQLAFLRPVTLKNTCNESINEQVTLSDDISSNEQDPASKVIPSYQRASNSLHQVSIIDSSLGATAPSEQVLASDIPSSEENSQHFSSVGEVSTNPQQLTTSRQESSSSGLPSFGCVSYENEASEFIRKKSNVQSGISMQENVIENIPQQYTKY